MDEIKIHTVTIEARKKICITQVSEVEGVTEERIKLVIVGGKKLSVFGSLLKMGAFSKQTGVFWAEGNIDEIKYSGEKGSLVKKLLK